MTNVIQLDKHRIKRESDTPFDKGCHHVNLIMRDKGELLYCEDCKSHISLYWALKAMCSSYQTEMAAIEARAEQLKKDEIKIVHLKSAKIIEQVWRSGKHAVTCPHCRRGILPEDSTGSMSRELEIARRKKELSRWK